MEKLAIFGGNPVKTTPYGTGKRFGDEEVVQLREALEQNTLFYWFGKKTKQMNEKFAKMYGVKYSVAASSGTAAIHVALGTIGITAGDEVITSPITDVGSVIGILAQNAIPVFADVDPNSYNITAESIEAKITDKTKAVIVVHLAGNAADMDAIMAVAKKHNIKVIEDCAQSYMCYYKGKLAGTIGDIGCFSLNDFKHISAGDGGMCIMNSEDYYYKAMKFADKNYKRIDAANLRSVDFLAPNYRMNELTAAVAIAQLDKVQDICNKRNTYGDGITAGIKGLKGLTPHKVESGGKASYWFYLMRMDEKQAGVTKHEFVEALKAEGINSRVGYIPSCVYEYPMFTNKNVYPGTKVPFNLPEYGRHIEYKKGDCPVAEEVLDSVIFLPVNEFFTSDDLNETVAAIQKVSKYYLEQTKNV